LKEKQWLFERDGMDGCLLVELKHIIANLENYASSLQLLGPQPSRQSSVDPGTSVFFGSVGMKQ
jgi:hypothetical protein